MKDWFTVDQIDEFTYIISEYQHWEENHSYLLVGDERALLIDTGLGIGDIGSLVRELTQKQIAAVATHVHWDHIGGHKDFSEIYTHKAELHWLDGNFPLHISEVRRMLADHCVFPNSFSLEEYRLFQGKPTELLEDGDVLDLGGRWLQVFHTPGHSPGHLCFWEEKTGYLFTGDLVYLGTLLADFPSTDPVQYLSSLEKVAKLPAKRLFPGHHSLDITPDLVRKMRDAFAELAASGKLYHGSGCYHYNNWAVRL